MKSKIVAKHWFTQGAAPHTFGVVVCHDDITGQRKAYIGSGLGIDEEDDAIHIQEYGAKINSEMLRLIADQIENLSRGEA